ncbi:ABC-type transporter ATP-binding protein EcsA [Ruminiclostridium hungatei]|uniref:ABC-type transporter ATP-binding protein EcsA n=1 Tax=Ruminiclostridium hungatei TaxID=48256 RepID=A0A1V4SMT3_RUMHU|nr:ATP-binding cassette domain-containing protein [Ruminiclostridium hungatei]OPX45199.1 ABC-type transporter ATP-binding protein EcsA [Ruminiclostridium hungatei]
MGLVVNGLSKSFNGNVVVKNLSFSCEEGKVFGLLGRNGSGKTTTLRMIMGIIKRDSGEVAWNGEKLSRQFERIGYLPEERGIYIKEKVSEQLIYFATLKGLSQKKAKSAVQYWLKKFNIEEYYDRKVETLSKGNQQKIQLIVSILHDPEIVLFDEPFSGLDPVNMEILKEVINELKVNGKCIVLSSHLMDFVEKYCEDVLLLKNGETIVSGKLSKIKGDYNRKNLIIRTGEDIRAVLDKKGIFVSEALENQYTAKVKDEQEAQGLLQQLVADDVSILRYELTEPTLHEIFIEKAGD